VNYAAVSRKWKQKKLNQKESEFFMSVKTVRMTELSTILTIKRRREKRESDCGIPFFIACKAEQAIRNTTIYDLQLSNFFSQYKRRCLSAMDSVGFYIRFLLLVSQ
jgi:hypothetical protein